jgi:hypothetical protein
LNGVAGRNGARAVIWNFRSADDVKEFWKKFRRVPARRRWTKRDEERYCLALYFLALATYRKLKYPLRIEEGESPDFIVTWSSGKTIGLSVIKATEMWVEHEVAKVDGKPDWFSYVRRAIESKARTLKSARSDLLVYEDEPLPLIEQAQALTALRDWLSGIKCANTRLGRISIIISLGLALERGNNFQYLPFINWSNPGGAPDFGERVEFEGFKAVRTAIRKHLTAGHWISYTDSRGRLMRLMPDGRRVEVAMESDGEKTASA